mgnify:CR=1 FL=1
MSKKRKKITKKSGDTKPSPQKKQRKINKKGIDWQGFVSRYRWALLLILAAILLRFVDLGRQGLWIDEMCTWNDAHAPYERIFNTVHEAVFLLEKLSLSIGGNNEYFLRLPSAFGGLMAVIFMYLLARLLYEDKRTAIYALVLIAFSPINIYYSQDSNYYGLMMGFTALSLYFMFLFVRKLNPLWLIPYGISAYINYKVHMANILVIGVQILTISLFLLTSKRFRVYGVNLFRKVTQNKVALAASAAALLIILIFGGVRFLNFFKRMAFRSYGDAPVTENLELTPRFFYTLAMDYGVAFQQYKIHVVILTLFVIGFFLFGLIYSLRKRSYFGLFVLFSWTLPFIAIYIKKVGHFYHCRYTSFIVPGFLIIVACGIRQIELFFRKKFGDKAGRASLIAMFLLIFAGIAPNLLRYYTGQKQDWKGAVVYLEKNLEPGEVVTSNIYCNFSSLQFYFKYLEMDPDPVIQLSGEFRGAALSRLVRLKKLCYTKPGVYFATSYTRYETKFLWDWVKKYFDRVYYAPSLHPEEFNREGKEVILYKFKWTDAFVLPPFRYQYEFEQQKPASDTVSKELLFGEDNDYRIGFELTEISENNEFVISVKNDAGEIKEKPAEVAGDQNRVYAKFDLKEGVYNISLIPENSPSENSRVKALFAGVVVKYPYMREAEDTDEYHPTPWKRIENIDGEKVFTLERSNYVTYEEIPFGDGGPFVLTVKALEDDPGPVMMEVSVNHEPVGLLYLEKGDNTWSEKNILFDAPPGNHPVTFHFVNLPDQVNKLIRGKMPSDRSKDTDMSLDYFTVRPLDGNENLKDDTLDITQSVVTAASFNVQRFENPQNEGNFAPGWQLMPQLDVSFDPPGVDEDENIIRIEVPAKAGGFNLVSPPFPVKPGGFVYLSARLKAENLNNHSANMKIVYIDENKQPVGQQVINADGITGDTRWVRQLCLRPVPSNARAAAIIFWVYRNSRAYAQSAGYVWLEGIRFETPPEPGLE